MLFLGLEFYRYPDPSHPKIRRRMAELRGLPSTNHGLLGVGSDKVIRPSHACLIHAGMRKDSHYPAYLRDVVAQVNDVGIVKVMLPLNALGKVEREEKVDDSACVWTRYVSNSLLLVIFSPTGALCK